MRLSILTIEFGVWEVCRDHHMCEALWRWLGGHEIKLHGDDEHVSQPPQPSSPSKLLRPAIKAAHTIAVTTWKVVNQ
jgi:hypothetical protein